MSYFPHSFTQLVSRILISSPVSGLSPSCPDWLPHSRPYPRLTLLLQLLQAQYFCLPDSLGPSLLQNTSFLFSQLLPRSKSLPTAIPIPGFILCPHSQALLTLTLTLNLSFGPDPLPTTSFLSELSELFARPSLQPPSLNCLSQATSGLLPSRYGSYCLHFHT